MFSFSFSFIGSEAASGVILVSAMWGLMDFSLADNTGYVSVL